MQVQVITDKLSSLDGKALLSHPKERASTTKLNGLIGGDSNGEADAGSGTASSGAPTSGSSHHHHAPASNMTRARSVLTIPESSAELGSSSLAANVAHLRLQDRLQGALQGKTHSNCRIS